MTARIYTRLVMQKIKKGIKILIIRIKNLRYRMIKIEIRVSNFITKMNYFLKEIIILSPTIKTLCLERIKRNFIKTFTSIKDVTLDTLRNKIKKIFIQVHNFIIKIRELPFEIISKKKFFEEKIRLLENKYNEDIRRRLKSFTDKIALRSKYKDFIEDRKKNKEKKEKNDKNYILMIHKLKIAHIKSIENSIKFQPRLALILYSATWIICLFDILKPYSIPTQLLFYQFFVSLILLLWNHTEEPNILTPIYNMIDERWYPIAKINIGLAITNYVFFTWLN